MRLRSSAVRALASIAAIGLVAPWATREARARPLQIIHTNDLHSHLDHAADPTRGGYAALKAAIDRLKSEALAAGIDTLTLDGGDFSEDSQYYLADRGLQAWKAMGAMGYDAVVIGNHDWLAGLDGLDDVVGRASPPFAFLGANFIFTWSQKNLVKHMRKALEVVRAGARIAVYGLTTDDLEYAWMADPGFIHDPVWAAQEDVPKLRARNDFVIALTHLGTSADRVLAWRGTGIDLIVGGHSHTALEEPVIVQSGDGRKVPIVQTGMHARYVGDLLVDVEPGKPLQVLRYRLEPVHADGPRDEAMERTVEEARAALDRDYGAEWLREVVGFSEVPLENAFMKGEPTVWSRFLADAIRETGSAEAAIDVTQFEGFDQPAGPVTREQLFVLYPRVFEFGKRYGWTVWTAAVKGWAIQLAIEKTISLGLPVHASGITWDLDANGKPVRIRIGGHPVSATRAYKIALPEGLVRGAYGISKYLGLIIQNARDTQVPIWSATEKKLKQLGTIRADYGKL